jgi:hypothetical protein
MEAAWVARKLDQIKRAQLTYTVETTPPDKLTLAEAVEAAHGSRHTPYADYDEDVEYDHAVTHGQL